MSEEISINILGVCVLRDIFALNEHNTLGEGYAVHKYTSAFAPLYAVDDGTVDIDVDKYNNNTQIPTPNNFIKRCILQDVTRKSIDWIKQYNSDFLLVDVALLRTDYVELANGELYYGGYKEVFDYLSANDLIPKVTGTKPFNFLTDEELKSRLQIFFSKVLEIYPIDKIILFEVKNVFEKADLNNGFISNFSDSAIEKSKKQNTWLDKCFEYSKEILKGCHTVYFPKNVIGDENHHLGQAPMHYTQEYYDYAVKAINVICRENLPLDEEVKKLESMMDFYSEKYKALREKMTIISPKTQDWLKRKNDDHRLVTNAMNFCFEVMMDTLDRSLFLRYIKSLSGKNVSVLAHSCKAGNIFKKAALAYGVNIAYSNNKVSLNKLTPEEFSECKKSDVIISCCVHGTKTHECDGVKCIDIWDILRDKTLTADLPPLTETPDSDDEN